MATRSKHVWKKDAQGQFARQIGWKKSRNGKRLQHKFRLGDDAKLARRLEQRIEELWERVEKNTSTGTLPSWDDTTLSIARELAKGESEVILHKVDQESDLAFAQRVEAAQAMYAVVPIRAGDAGALAKGTAELELAKRKEAEALAQRQAEEAKKAFANVEILRWEPDLSHLEGPPHVILPFPMGSARTNRVAAPAATLHAAMDDYIAKIRQDYHNEHLGRITASGAMKIKEMELLKSRHADRPLMELEIDEVESMFLYWRKRPLRKGTTRPISRKSAMHAIGELSRFFRWLHRTPKYAWRKPEDFDDIETGVIHLPSDHTETLDKVKTFTLDELVLLNKYATPQRGVLSCWR